MSFLRLLLQSLIYYARTNLAVLLGALVGSSVLTGALLVGDSMRGTLRAMTLERLGEIDQAVVGARFFRKDLPARLQQSLDNRLPLAASAILMKAAVSGPENRRVRDVQIIGTTKDFWNLFPNPDPTRANRIVVNDRLARGLGLEFQSKPAKPPRIILHIQEETEVPRDAPLGRRDVVPKSVPLEIAQIVPDTGVGRFSLELSQKVPATLFVPIETLAAEIKQPGRANALFLGPYSGTTADSIAKALSNSITLDDLGITLSIGGGWVSIESRENILPNSVADTAKSLATEHGWQSQSVLSYLANTIAVGNREVPYSIATALDIIDAPPFGPLGNSTPLKPGDILLNQSTADRLAAKVGDQVRLDYYIVHPDGSLGDGSHTFQLAGILPMSGVAIDRGYVPEFKGITDADTIGEWDAPFDIKLERIKKPDEDYWRDYRTAPKAFLRLDDGQKIWSTRFGNQTSVRIAVPSGETPEEFRDRLAAELRRRLDVEKLGFHLMPIRQQDLRASSGSTDFGVLFLSMSFFLIASAVLLVGLLFRLNTDLRASSIGVLLAVGLRPARVRLLLIAEGGLLAAVGSALGLFGAVFYAQWILQLLSSRWQSAVGTSFVDFHWTWLTFAIGWTSSVFVAVLAIAWATRRIYKAPVPQLLSGGFLSADATASSRRRLSLVLAGAGLAAGLALVVAGLSGWMTELAAFFGSGAALLMGALGCLSALLSRPIGRDPAALVRGTGGGAIVRLGVRNAARYPARSLTTATLLALAVFLVVAVGSMRHATPSGIPDKSSGNGGFSLLAKSATPLTRDLNTPDGRFAMNVSDKAEKLLKQSEIFGFRVRPGDDASCLNIYQPTDPTILAAPDSFVKRGGFAFASSLAKTEPERAIPWTLLDKDLGDNVVPAIGDAATLQWILKVPVGSDLEIKDEAGRPIRLRIVAGLSESVFQGQLIIGEANFLRLFPSIAGKGFFLLSTTPSESTEIASLLSRDLADFGFEVESTRDVIAGYLAVQATYMAAFETLGGLGLLLGTLGLAAVLLRSVFERRGELALLSALGFRASSIAGLILSETTFLLAAGLLIGAACAFVAVAPQLRHLADWSAALPLAATLLGVLLLGLASGLLATFAALRTPLLQALRAERT